MQKKKQHTHVAAAATAAVCAAIAEASLAADAAEG